MKTMIDRMKTPGQIGQAEERPPHVRVREWDILRSGAFAAVVLQHLLGAWAKRPEIGVADQMFCAAAFEPLRFAVPMFVFLFGCALFYTYPKGVAYGRYLKKRLLQLGVPYAVWTVIYLLLAGAAFSPDGLLRHLLMGTGSYHLWYVVMILQFVIVTPLFYAFKGKGSALPLVAGAGVLIWLIYLGVTPGWNIGRIFSAVFVRHRTLVFLSWLGFFLLGALCGAYRERFIRWTSRLLPLTGAAYGFSVCWAAWKGTRFVLAEGSVNFSCVGFLNPDYALFTLCGIAFWYECARRLAASERFSRFCAWVGAHSYEAYLAHVLVLTRGSLWLVQHADGLPLRWFYGVLGVITLVGSLLLGWAIDGMVQTVRRAARKRKGILY